jgi:hypothetical protein
MAGNGLVLNFPVWTVVTKSTFKNDGLALSIPKLSSQQHGAFTTVFRRRELAEKFIVTSFGTKSKLFRPQTIQDVPEFTECMKTLEESGCNSVLFDHQIVRGMVEGEAWPICRVIEECGKWGSAT